MVSKRSAVDSHLFLSATEAIFHPQQVHWRHGILLHYRRIHIQRFSTEYPSLRNTHKNRGIEIGPFQHPPDETGVSRWWCSRLSSRELASSTMLSMASVMLTRDVIGMEEISPQRADLDCTGSPGMPLVGACYQRTARRTGVAPHRRPILLTSEPYERDFPSGP